MSSIVGRFLSGSYQVTRNRGIKYVEGFPQDLGDETIQVCGSMQPLSARDIKFLDEGSRLRQSWKFYTDCPVVVIGTKKIAKADIIQVKDDTRDVVETYKVVSTESWHGFDLEYYKAIIVREPEQ